MTREKEKVYLGDVLGGITYSSKNDIRKVPISGVSSDSRDIEFGDFFIAVLGNSVDGHQYIPEAISKGCSAVLIEKDHMSPELDTGVIPVIEVEDSLAALGQIAANYYGHPARKLQMIAVTGTNGKTTTTYLVEAIITGAGGRPGVIGTVTYRYPGKNNVKVEQPASFTTPEPVLLHRLLRRMVDNGVTHVVMEVSSHAITLKRLEGLLFDTAVFTNLSRDHLDFHGDMESYFDSKKKLFSEHLKPEGQAVVMLEPTTTEKNKRNGQSVICWGKKLTIDLKTSLPGRGKNIPRDNPLLSQNLTKIITYGLDKTSDVHPEQFSYDLQGITARISTPQGLFHLRSHLLGEFNIKNILAATGVGITMRLNCNKISTGLAEVKDIPGRLERVKSKEGTAIFVDYAHTPDALKNVLITLQSLKPTRLICVFGCGGDRDPGKRPMMGETAGKLCDVVLATSDNPRTEKPDKILAEIETGLVNSSLQKVPADLLLKEKNRQGYDLITSRREAIRKAVHLSQPGDVVLISGKGHENYQITNAGKIYFDDRVEATKHLT